MTSYKLTYFKGTGRAEVARMLFALAGEKYEDCRISPEDWPKLKSSTLMGQLPILEFDGIVLCQSNTINRYLARKFGFAGSTHLEEAQVDMVVDCINDYLIEFTCIDRVDGEEKEKLTKKLIDERFPYYMNKYETMLSSSETGFFVGKEVTWADLAFTTQVLSFAAFRGMNLTLDNYPRLQKLVSMVKSHPKISAWIETRPKTMF